MYLWKPNDTGAIKLMWKSVLSDYMIKVASVPFYRIQRNSHTTCIESAELFSIRPDR